MGEVWGTNPLELLDANDHDWVILAAAAEVLRRDQEEREEQRRREAGDIGVT